MEDAAIYIARSVPRIDGDRGARLRERFIVAQQSLWNAVQVLLVHRLGMSVEFRIQAIRSPDGPIDGSERINLLVILHPARQPNASKFQEAVRMVEMLLPLEYAWERIDTAGVWWSRRLASESPSWSIARVLRRIDIAPVPDGGFSLRRVLQSAPSPATSATTSEKSTIVAARPDPDDADSFGFAERSLRFPDHRLKAMLRELARGGLVLPVFAPIRIRPDGMRRVFQDLDHQQNTAISFAMHPVTAASLRPDRSIAALWRRLLEAVAPGLSNAGLGSMQEVLSAYDRYQLPTANLCSLTIRVAALSAAAATGIAQHVATMLGGARAYHVIPPSRADSLFEKVYLGDVDVPTDQWSEEHWQRQRRMLIERITQENGKLQTPATPYLDFLLRCPHLYTADEAESIMALPVADEEGLAGLSSQMVPPFNAASQRWDPVIAGAKVVPPPADRVRIGMRRALPVARESRAWREPGAMHWHSIPTTDLTKHALVVGSTGSGKTQATLFLIRECARLSLPFMVVEPVKTEYADRLGKRIPGLRRVNLEADSGFPSDHFLRFDPMRLQEGVSVARHASYLKSCFEAAFPLEPWMAVMLEGGIRSYYCDPVESNGCGLGLFESGGRAVHSLRDGRVYPSLDTFREFFVEHYLPRALRIESDSGDAKGRAEEIQQIFRRRFDNLLSGVFGEACRRADHAFVVSEGVLYEQFADLLNEAVVIELDAVPDSEQKALVMAFLLTFLFERRQADDLSKRRGDSSAASTPHVLVIEEAHRLLANSSGGSRGGETVGQDSRAKAVSLFVDMLAEIRAYGQGIVIVEQIPTKLATEAVKNTNLKVMLRLTSKDDREYLGDAMNFTDEQKRFVTGLRARSGEGIQMVVFDEGVDQPMLLSLPLPAWGDQTPGWVFDEFFDAGGAGGAAP